MENIQEISYEKPLLFAQNT